VKPAPSAEKSGSFCGGLIERWIEQPLVRREYDGQRERDNKNEQNRSDQDQRIAMLDEGHSAGEKADDRQGGLHDRRAAIAGGELCHRGVAEKPTGRTMNTVALMMPFLRPGRRGAIDVAIVRHQIESLQRGVGRVAAVNGLASIADDDVLHQTPHDVIEDRDREE
jgi:hypothetical protein